jgi:hypothetical protein
LAASGIYIDVDKAQVFNLAAGANVAEEADYIRPG